MSPFQFKQMCIQYIENRLIETENKEILLSFFDYMNAYCAELKVTEYDILFDEKLFNKVFNLFDSVVIKNKYQKT